MTDEDLSRLAELIQMISLSIADFVRDRAKLDGQAPRVSELAQTIEMSANELLVLTRRGLDRKQ